MCLPTRRRSTCVASSCPITAATAVRDDAAPLRPRRPGAVGPGPDRARGRPRRRPLRRTRGAGPRRDLPWPVDGARRRRRPGGDGRDVRRAVRAPAPAAAAGDRPDDRDVHRPVGCRPTPGGSSLAQALRAFAYGLGAVLLGATLDDPGLRRASRPVSCWRPWSPARSLASVAVARRGDRWGRRRSYRGLYLLLAVTGVVFAFGAAVAGCWPLVALVGALSTEVVESGPFTSLEQAMLADRPARATSWSAGFALYNAVAAAAGSVGALAAARPDARPRRVGGRPADQRFFLVFVPVALAGAVIASRCPRPSSRPSATADPARRVLGRRGRSVLRLAGAVRRRLLRAAGSPCRRSSPTGSPTASAPPSAAARRRVRRRRGPADRVVPGRRPPRRAVRAARHDGLHPPAVQRAARRRGVRAELRRSPSRCCSPAVALSQMDVPTRQAYVMALVDPGRAHRRGRDHQHRPLRRPPVRRRSLGGAVAACGPRAAVRDRRHRSSAPTTWCCGAGSARVPAAQRRPTAMIVCLRTVAVPAADVRDRYLAWIAEGRAVREAHGILAELRPRTVRRRRRHRRDHGVARATRCSTPGSPRPSATRSPPPTCTRPSTTSPSPATTSPAATSTWPRYAGPTLPDQEARP